MPLSLWQQLVDEVSFVPASGYLATGIAKPPPLKTMLRRHTRIPPIRRREALGTFASRIRFRSYHGYSRAWEPVLFGLQDFSPLSQVADEVVMVIFIRAQRIAVDVHLGAAKGHINTALSQRSLRGLLQMHELVGSESLPEMTYQQKVLLISKYYQLASCIVLLYDYFLTFGLEVERVWERSFAFPEVLFYLNRYFPLLSYIWILIAYHQTSWPSSFSNVFSRKHLRRCFRCETFLHFPLTMNVISDSVICTIVVLRLYAMYLGKLKVLVFLGALAVVQIGLGAWASREVALLDVHPYSGCIITVKDGSYFVFGLLWAWSVLFDSTACFMTVWKCMQTRRSLVGRVETPLLDLLVRDGVVYFIVMFSAKVVNLVVFWLLHYLDSIVQRDLITINWTFNHTITVIMISRLFLNLRAAGSLTCRPSQPSVQQDMNDLSSPMKLDDL
ncbi:hypothetical protein ACEPAF_9506 [Sanghuangporus sanghuang]